MSVDTETIRDRATWDPFDDCREPSWVKDFDEWLLGVQADAWESGLNTGIGYGRVMQMGLPEPTNPYREE